MENNNNLDIKIDDRYVKVDVPKIIWAVSRILNLPDAVPHVALVQEGKPSRQITLSVPALMDTTIYKKIDPT